MQTLKLKQIIPDKNQPRKYFSVEKMSTLKDSIKRHGIITPLIVQETEDKDIFLLVDGERRYRSAVELGLSEVPVQVQDPKNDFNRMVEQFHIQEQHESWSSVEKAMAIIEIAQVSKLPLKEVCELLSIEERMFRYYKAFSELQGSTQDKMVDYGVSLKNAEKIREVNKFTKNIIEKVLDEPFTKANSGKLEKILVEKIRNKEIVNSKDYARIKDSFRSNPKLINKFMTEDFDIDENFITSNAKGAYHARNMITSGNYFLSNGLKFLEEQSVKLTSNDIRIIKRIEEVAKQLIDLVE